MKGKDYHICLDVSGYIKGATRDLRRLFRRSDGSGFLNPSEARSFLKEQAALGVRVMPFGPPCEGFDYSGGGCPGHDVEAPDGPQA